MDERRPRVRFGLVPATIDTEIDVGEADPRRNPIAIEMRLEVPLQLCGSGLDARGQILGHERDALRQAAPDNGVPLVEPHRKRFPVEDFLADMRLHEPLKLGLGRGALPLHRPELSHTVEVSSIRFTSPVRVS